MPNTGKNNPETDKPKDNSNDKNESLSNELHNFDSEYREYRNISAKEGGSQDTDESQEQQEETINSEEALKVLNLIAEQNKMPSDLKQRELELRVRELAVKEKVLNNNLLEQQVRLAILSQAERIKYGGKVFDFLIAWVAAVFVLIIADAISINRPESTVPSPSLSFDIDSIVLSTIAGGTTVAAIGLVGFLIKGLYPQSTRSSSDKE